MSMTRKEFLCLTAAFCAGCKSIPSGAPAGPARTVDAGPASQYAAEGVYDQFAEEGFFLVRKDGHLIALSSYCTHRRCQLEAEKDRTYYCDCHGSTFDPGGKVTHGPATRDLPVFPTVENAAGHVLVTVYR